MAADGFLKYLIVCSDKGIHGGKNLVTFLILIDRMKTRKTHLHISAQYTPSGIADVDVEHRFLLEVHDLQMASKCREHGFLHRGYLRIQDLDCAVQVDFSKKYIINSATICTSWVLIKNKPEAKTGALHEGRKHLCIRLGSTNLKRNLV